jgi:copper chaperone
MKKQEFKTTIKCSGCVATVAPHLNKAVGENNWVVDINSADKILTVTSDLSESEVIATVREAGYTAIPK